MTSLPATIRRGILTVALIPAHVLSGQVLEQQQPPTDQRDLTGATSSYLRVLRNDKDEPIAMETSVVSFRQKGPDANDVRVDLIGAVHVADKSYYEQLDRLFEQYDAVLYELVAPENNNVPAEGRSRHPVGQMQQGMKGMLGLAFQLEEIDYGKKNFVHADMSPVEFSRVMSERGESFLQIMLRMMGQSMVMQGKSGRGNDMDLLRALFAPDRSLHLKRIISTQFEDLEGAMGAIEGKDGSTLIGQRNDKALSVLRKELSSGKKNIAIFYGAGHNPDMEEKLTKEFGLHPDKNAIRWLTAWDMRSR